MSSKTYASIDSSMVPIFYTGNYRHLVLSISGNTHTLYLDGNIIAVNNNAGNVFANYSSISELTISSTADLSFGYTGLIDDFRIYNRALDITDVSCIYNSYNRPFVGLIDGSFSNQAYYATTQDTTRQRTGDYPMITSPSIVSYGWPWTFDMSHYSGAGANANFIGNYGTNGGGVGFPSLITGTPNYKYAININSRYNTSNAPLLYRGKLYQTLYMPIGNYTLSFYAARANTVLPGGSYYVIKIDSQVLESALVPNINTAMTYYSYNFSISFNGLHRLNIEFTSNVLNYGAYFQLMNIVKTG
jgi:hypothetical protein